MKAFREVDFQELKEELEKLEVVGDVYVRRCDDYTTLVILGRWQDGKKDVEEREFRVSGEVIVKICFTRVFIRLETGFVVLDRTIKEVEFREFPEIKALEVIFDL